MVALYLVCTKSRKDLTQYKKLLIIFLVSDLFYTLLQDLLKPVILTTIFGWLALFKIIVVSGELFLIFSSGSIDSKVLLSTYCGCVSMSFVIISFNFVFRALAISKFVSVFLSSVDNLRKKRRDLAKVEKYQNWLPFSQKKACSITSWLEEATNYLSLFPGWSCSLGCTDAHTVCVRTEVGWALIFFNFDRFLVTNNPQGNTLSQSYVISQRIQWTNWLYLAAMWVISHHRILKNYLDRKKEASQKE